MVRKDFYNDPAAPAANSITVAVSVVVQQPTGEILLIRRTDNNLYSIPGGGQEIGETLAETAVREVAEETGISTRVVELIGVYSDPKHVIAYTDGEVKQEFSICFRAEPISGELRTSNESSDVQWISPEDIEELDMHPSIRLRIEHGLARLEKPFFS
ncbi:MULTISPECIES: NUDIX domain-containing protein [unclassified Crossiella]|uniref:NUDIX hydrolase n=1 Tax=unclassified Crossiella TaxID=2620835 RepID=UPI001FFF930E|nr:MULTISPECIES: NUDIX domain-containing protein [unclassified Crossiella]MCK2237829.1 NUDIX domain-containing protein [Crossiella sp. S99.2]MCK2255115.1 NUDIX domain-containing protein [Crossiella sp. S99.1]